MENETEKEREGIGMGSYYLNLDELSEYTGESVADLKKRSYMDLETMIENMQADKIMKRNNRNAADAEYERLVFRYFQPFPFLKHWFDEREIVLACAHTGVTVSDLCQEVKIQPGYKCGLSNAEYLRTSFESVPQFDKMGRELMQRKQEKMDVYRVASHYQGLCHGKVILHLLYGRYPELAKFEFNAYGMDSCSSYEIYPKTGVYVPFEALMDGDIDAILLRNRDYCAWYNNGRYTTEECEKAFRSEKVMEMFDVIRKISEKERAAGHSFFGMNSDENPVDMNDLKQTVVSKDGNLELFETELRPTDRKKNFKIRCAAPCTVEHLINEYREMTGRSCINICICHITDYLREYGINIKIRSQATDWMKQMTEDCFKHTVYSASGHIHNGTATLIIRIDCPKIGN